LASVEDPEPVDLIPDLELIQPNLVSTMDLTLKIFTVFYPNFDLEPNLFVAVYFHVKATDAYTQLFSSDYKLFKIVQIPLIMMM
jgi:hypothetical protein